MLYTRNVQAGAFAFDRKWFYLCKMWTKLVWISKFEGVLNKSLDCWAAFLCFIRIFYVLHLWTYAPIFEVISPTSHLAQFFSTKHFQHSEWGSRDLQVEDTCKRRMTGRYCWEVEGRGGQWTRYSLSVAKRWVSPPPCWPICRPFGGAHKLLKIAVESSNQKFQNLGKNNKKSISSANANFCQYFS